MHKRKVMSFFIFLLLFAGALMYLQLRNFGSLTGLTVSSDTTSIEPLQTNFFGDAFTFLILFFMMAFIARFLFSHYSRKAHFSSEEPRRKLIPVDIGSHAQ